MKGMDKNARFKFQKDAETFYMAKFDGAKKDADEKYGDFYITLNDRIIGFEVYTPEENLSLSTKILKKETKEVIKNPDGISIGEGFGGGLSPNRLSELVERALSNKANQFGKKVNYPKILIVCCYMPGSFNSVSAFVSEWNPLPKIENLFCSAIFVAGGVQNHYIRNMCPKFSLEQSEHDFVNNRLNTPSQ